MPDPQTDSQDEENAFLTPFLKYCESNPITAVRELEDAPEEVKNLLRAHQLRPMMMKHIFIGKISQCAAIEEPDEIYADE